MPRTFHPLVGKGLSPGTAAFGYLFVAKYNYLGSLLVFHLFFQDMVSGLR